MAAKKTSGPPCSSCGDLRKGLYPEWTAEDHPCMAAGHDESRGSWLDHPRNPCLCGCAEKFVQRA